MKKLGILSEDRMENSFDEIAKRRINGILRSGIIVLLVAFIVLALTIEPRMLGYTSYEPTTINDQWVQEVDGAEVELDSVLHVVDVQGDVIIERTLPEIKQGEVLLFYSQNQEVEVYVEDALIYEFKMRDNLRFLDSPGSMWNEIPLDPTMSGEDIRIEITCDNYRYSSQVRNMYLTYSSGKILLELEQSWFQTVMGILIVLIAAYGYMRGYKGKDKAQKKRVFLTADFYLWMGMWVLAECGAIDIWLRRPAISYVISMLALRVIPVVFLSVLLISVKVHVEKLEFMRCIMWINLLLTIVLQVTGKSSFLDGLAVNTFFVVLNSLMCCIYFIYSIIKGKKQILQDNFFLCCFMVFIGAAIDLGVYMIDEHYTKGMGLGTCVAMLLFTGTQFVMYTRRKRAMEERTKELEKTLDLVRYTVLAKQMNAHFLNNTLNTISALCKVDPLEADKAIKSLSKYLRVNMYLIEQEQAIPFSKEMELVNAYLDIEKMRFEDRFEVELDLPFSDFQVPPLSIQPIVENAIVHGFRNRIRGGRIWLRTERMGEWVKVIIEDNGVGFLEKDLQRGDSLGIKNLRKRLKIIANGSIEIYSETNKGSRITMSVPINLAESHKEVEQ